MAAPARPGMETVHRVSESQAFPGMELLAPAGTAVNFLAALDEGADAVYVGAPGCNARALGRDFSWNELRGLIDRAHEAGARCYFAMNSLVKEGELGQAVETLARIEALSADGIIIQDLGLAAVARRFFPALPLHASTLLSAHSAAGVRQLAGLGFVRMVLARELTLAEIEAIGRDSGAALEVFVQGAMCFSYSGLCLFSSLHGGKSSLRGRCVQPCRRRYLWEEGQGRSRGRGRGDKRGGRDAGGYLFSMNDLSAIELLPELARAGVVSLKIEGRLRSTEYVRLTTRAYRLALDNIALSGAAREAMLDEARSLLHGAMGRRAFSGYLRGGNPTGAISPQHSGNIGHFLGRVTAVAARGRAEAAVALRLRHAIGLGDRLRLHDDASGERLAFTLKALSLAGRPVRRADAGAEVRVGLPPEARTLLTARFSGSLYRVDVAGEDKGRTVAVPRPSVPPAWDRRRAAAVLHALRPSAAPPPSPRRPVWWVRVATVAEALLRFPRQPERILVPLGRESLGHVSRHRGGLARRRERIIWCLPPIIQPEEQEAYEQAIGRLLDDGFRQFQLAHFSQVPFFAEQRERSVLFGDFTCNILNGETLRLFHELGLIGAQLPLDADSETLAATLAEARRSPGLRVGLTVYGRPALFTSRLAVDHFRFGRAFASPKGEEFFLIKEEGLTKAAPAIPLSLLEELPEIERLGFDYLVLDLRHGDAGRMLADIEERLRGVRLRRLAGNFTGGLV